MLVNFCLTSAITRTANGAFGDCPKRKRRGLSLKASAQPAGDSPRRYAWDSPLMFRKRTGQQPPERRPSTEKEKGELLLMPCEWIWISRPLSLRMVVRPWPAPLQL